jgi:hypothetical protein
MAIYLYSVTTSTYHERGVVNARYSAGIWLPQTLSTPNCHWTIRPILSQIKYGLHEALGYEATEAAHEYQYLLALSSSTMY